VKKWTKIAAAFVAVLLMAGGVWCRRPDNEPVYKGKRPGEYLYSASDDISFDEANKAFKFFGTNAVPCIRAGLRTRDTWDRKVLVWVAAKAPWLKIRARTATQEHVAALSMYIDIVNSGYWGDAKAACAPDVHNLVNDSDPEVRRLATLVRGSIAGFQWELR